MTIEKKNVSPCVVALTIKAEPAEFQAEYDKVEKEYLKNASIPGFRKGKTPLSLIRSKFGKDINNDAAAAIFRTLYPEAVKQEKLDVVALSGVSEIRVVSGQEFVCVANVEVVPEFKLPKYKKIAIKAEETSVTDEDVKKHVENVRASYAKYEDGKPEDVLETGDFASFDFSGTLDDKAKTPIKDIVDEKMAGAIAERTGFWTLLEEGRFIPEVCEALAGMKAGETKEGIKVKFPKDNPCEALAGKKALYTVTVKEIRKRILMDDEALSKALKDESFDATVKRIRADLEKNAVEQNKIAKQNAVVEALLSKSDFEVPMSQVLSESEKGVREYIQRARYMGMQDSDFEARREEIMSSIMDHSKKQVRLTYILDAIAKEEKIVATDEDIIARLGDVAASQPKPTTAEEIFENIRANGNLDGARAQVVGEKVIEFIIENAK